MYLDLATKNQRIIWRSHLERNFLFLSFIWQCSCSGGGIEVACPLMEAVVNFFSHLSLQTDFQLQILPHLPWTSGFSSLISFSPTFSIFHFLHKFVRDAPIFFLPSSSLLNSYASCTKYKNLLCSLSPRTTSHCLCWDPAIRT